MPALAHQRVVRGIDLFILRFAVRVVERLDAFVGLFALGFAQLILEF